MSFKQVTTRDYDPDIELYTLDIPNKVIRVGLFENLLPNYVDGIYAERGGVAIARMSGLIRHKDMDGALHLLQDYLGTVPYCNVTKTTRGITSRCSTSSSPFLPPS